ncbi:MAG TPA: AMP-binding protein [Candidatus Acidoferrales bacterium]
MSNFYQRFADAAARFPERTAVEVQRRERLDVYTYADLLRTSNAGAAELASRGVTRGDRCAILAENDFTWCAAYFGILRLGAIAVPLDTAYKPKQIAALLRDSGAKVFFTSPRYLDVVTEGIALAGAQIPVLLIHGPAPQGHSLPVLTDLARGTVPEPPPCPALAEDPAVILYTSGTTSDPKGVVLTHANLTAEAESVFSLISVTEEDCILGVLPLFHALAQMANLLLPFAVGARVVFLETINTTELLRALAERGITLFACVPQFFYLIHQRVMDKVAKSGWLKRKLFRALLVTNGLLRRTVGLNLGRMFFRPVHAVLGSRMRFLVTGGSRFDPAIGRDLQKLGFNILQAYGLTETSGAACVMPPGDSAIGSVGPPLPGVEVKIEPPEKGGDHELPDGEVLIRGPVVMRGYFNRDDVNAVVLRDGWLRTGDLGYMDPKGRLYITGRKKEVIVLSSGKNIYPEEVEAHYLQSPFIKEICVLGRARTGEPSAERLHAVVVPDQDVIRERKVLNMREVLRFDMESLSAQLPGYKRVLGFDVWTDELPRTTTRKLKRFEIERRLAERAQAVEAESRREQTGADSEWLADPYVSRALEVIRESAKQKEAVHPDANIELELGLDSMERVELLTHLEEIFGVDVPDEVAQRIYTVRELVEALRPTGAAAASRGETKGDTWSRLLAEADESDPALSSLLHRRSLLSAVIFLKLKFLYALAWVFLGLRVQGRNHLPASGPCLLCPNHQSHLDAFLLVSTLPYHVLRNIFFVGASEYFQTPFRAWLARQIHLVPVDPDTKLVRAMQAGAFGLRNGKVLILFPEGERSIDGDVKKFKKGAPILSLHLKAPIVPVALNGVHEIMPRGRGFQWRALVPGGPRPLIRFGPPLPPPDALPALATLAQAEALYSAAAERLRARVVEMWQELRAGLARTASQE